MLSSTIITLELFRKAPLLDVAEEFVVALAGTVDFNLPWMAPLFPILLLGWRNGLLFL